MHKDVNIPYQQDSLNPPPSSLPRLPITALESIHPYVQPSASIIIPPFKNVPSDPSRKENQQHLLSLRRRIRQNPFRFQPPPRFFQRPGLYPIYPHPIKSAITSHQQPKKPKRCPHFSLPPSSPEMKTEKKKLTNYQAYKHKPPPRPANCHTSHTPTSPPTLPFPSSHPAGHPRAIRTVGRSARMRMSARLRRGGGRWC